MNKITLSLSLNEAKILYKEATLERKLELEELFPKLKPQLITDRVKTYEDALRVLGKKDFSHENLYNREVARRKLEIIIEALNEGWKPDWDNYLQLKWYPSFYGPIPSDLHSISYDLPTYAITNCCIRFFCKSKEISDYVGQQFLYLYKRMLLG